VRGPLAPNAFVVAAFCAGLACTHRTPLAAMPDGGGGRAGSAAFEGGAAGAAPEAGADGAPADRAVAAGFDPGFVGMRLLSDVEYANTIQDLLGLAGYDQQLRAALRAAGNVQGGGVDWFDNGPGASIPSWRYAAYYTNTVDLVA
jgi:hypothetical protein